MLIKATLLGIVIASTPLYIATTQSGAQGQDPARDAPASAATSEDPPAERARLAAELERTAALHASELERLQAALAEAERRCERAEAGADALRAQLEECMDFLLVPQTHQHGCRPTRSLLVHYQWMRRHGHEAHADKTLARIVEQHGDDNGNLNRLAWNLMTDEETTGKFDQLALALAQRMLQREEQLSHRELDTAALAQFLNGNVDEAIRLQQAAIERGGNNDDYRRRLRTYEAAKAAATPPAEPAEGAAPAPEKKIAED